MEAGRSLDLLVAEKVMGWAPIPEIDGQYHASDYWFNEKHVKKLVPYYSTDIAAAWEVVEKMKAEGCKLVLDDLGDKYQIAFRPKPIAVERQDGIHFIKLKYATGDTAPHAICLAALKARGVEV